MRTLGRALVVWASLQASQAHADESDDAAKALEAGRLDEAEQLYTRALAVRSSSALLADLCLTQYLRGDFGRALASCYRALEDPRAEDRVQWLLTVVRAELVAQRLPVAGLTLPDPIWEWFDPTPVRTRGAQPGPDAGQERFVPAPAREKIALDDTLAARLRGRAPRLPYTTPAPGNEYLHGLDVSAKTGLLFYGPDSSPLVFGARAELRLRRTAGEEGYYRVFAEYLQTSDRSGGIAAVGYGGYAIRSRAALEHGPGFDLALSVPWGKDDRRQDVAIPGYTTSLHLEARLGYRVDVAIARTRWIGIEAGISGGFNVPKIGKAFGRTAGNLLCTDDDDPDCDEDDPDPQWKSVHWMLHLAVSFGTRFDYPRYARMHIFAPSGARE